MDLRNAGDTAFDRGGLGTCTLANFDVFVQQLLVGRGSKLLVFQTSIDIAIEIARKADLAVIYLSISDLYRYHSAWSACV